MIGKILGHYRVLEKIGLGGMGEVYRASDQRLGRDVALKILKPSLAHDQDRLRRFEQEARAAAALSHPNIVAIYDIGMHEGAPYIVSELLEGQTLRERLLNGPILRRQAIDYARQIAQGLTGAHEKRIVHRDLKPENLFLTKDGRVKILDFGIAKLLNSAFDSEAGEAGSIASMTTQTRSGSLLGTIAYMSPEQLRGKVVDHRTDIFSFGAIFYEMLTGKRAFAGETQVDTMTLILKEDPPEMIREGQDIPESFEQVVRHCLEKEPENRFQSARDLAFALSTLAEVTTSRQILPFRLETTHLGTWMLRIIAALLLVTAAIYLGIRLRTVQNPEFRRVTFERGTVYSARFTPDGRTVVYGASWNGHPLQIYSTIPDSLLARPLGLSSAYLLGISRSSELALTMRGRPGSRLDFEGGMLADAPMLGGTPREILQDVAWADWSPDGQLAVVHHVNGRDKLEYPIGKVLYQTSGSISNIRFSPQGDRIAFLDHPKRWDDGGSVCVIDLMGHKTTLSSDWGWEYGLAWSPQGKEVWFSAVENGSSNRSLWALNLSGRQRKVLTAPGGLTMQDIAPDGRILATLDVERLAMEWSGKDKQVQDLSWYDWSIAKDISPDGQSVLFEEGAEPAGLNNAVAIRKVDGSPPIRLGDGTADTLSPDGKWAISFSRTGPARLTLLSVGPGQSREIALPELERLQNGAHFLPDGKRIVINGNEPGHSGRTYVVDAAGGKPVPVTPEGIYATLPSPDGKFLAGETADYKLDLFPLDGGPARHIPDVEPGYVLAQWSADSTALYVYRTGELPLKIQRLDIATGKTKPVRELVPPDLGGVVSIAPVITNLDASAFAYTYYQTFSVLYVVSGLN
ncbi:MAG TPA: protein kinase [Terriglobales bacterium]|nr:protein kinase [Terriglobales bacterium]